MVVKFHLKMDNDSILTYHVHNSNIKIGAVKKSATKPVDFLDMEVHGL